MGQLILGSQLPQQSFLSSRQPGIVPAVTLVDTDGNSLTTTNPLSVSFAASTATVLNQASAAQTGSGSTGSLSVGAYKELSVDVNVTALTGGTSPSIVFSFQRLGADGIWYTIYTGTAITAAGAQSTTIGVGAVTNSGFGGTVRLVWTFAGTIIATSITFSASIIGK